MPNDGAMTGEMWDLLPGLGLVKALVRLDEPWGEVDWGELGRRLRPGCTVILRLFFPGKLEAGEFVRRAVGKLPEVLGALGIASARPSWSFDRSLGKLERDLRMHSVCEPRNDREILIEIHNEPNHRDGIEGWGRSVEDARDFGWWYAEVLQGLRAWGEGTCNVPQRVPLQFGWPGLALSEWAHGERTFAMENRANVRASDWVGCHCYWQRPGELDLPQLGGNWRWYRRRWPNKRLFVTEAGNSWCHNPELAPVGPGEQLRQYLEWVRLASRGGVAGVAFYMLGGSEDWAGFRLFPETVRALWTIH